MPDVKPGEKRSDFVARCVPEVMREGLTQEQAVGKCEGMFDSSRRDGAIRKALEAPLPEGAPATGVTAPDRTGHSHGYAVRGGEGTTSRAAGHVHRVRGWLAEPAEDGHTHLLDRVFQGARAEKGEHGLPGPEAVRTAVDHLSEHPNYYRVLQSVGMSANSSANPLSVQKSGKPVGSTSKRADGSTWKKVGEGDWRKVPTKGDALQVRTPAGREEFNAEDMAKKLRQPLAAIMTAKPGTRVKTNKGTYEKHGPNQWSKVPDERNMRPAGRRMLDASTKKDSPYEDAKAEARSGAAEPKTPEEYAKLHGISLGQAKKFFDKNKSDPQLQVRSPREKADYRVGKILSRAQSEGRDPSPEELKAVEGHLYDSGLSEQDISDLLKKHGLNPMRFKE